MCIRDSYKEVIETWKETDDALTKALLGGLDKYNNIFMMADSGARGSDIPFIYGSALKALEDPDGEWGDKIMELMDEMCIRDSNIPVIFQFINILFSIATFIDFFC